MSYQPVAEDISGRLCVITTYRIPETGEWMGRYAFISDPSLSGVTRGFVSGPIAADAARALASVALFQGMDNEWKFSSERAFKNRWYRVEVKELGDKYYLRVSSSDGKSAVHDGFFSSVEMTDHAGHALAPTLIEKVWKNWVDQ